MLMVPVLPAGLLTLEKKAHLFSAWELCDLYLDSMYLYRRLRTTWTIPAETPNSHSKKGNLLFAYLANFLHIDGREICVQGKK
jgi:hypothetical protein